MHVLEKIAYAYSIKLHNEKFFIFVQKTEHAIINYLSPVSTVHIILVTHRL